MKLRQLDDLDFIRIPRKEIRHDKHYEEMERCQEQKRKIKAEVATKRALRKANNLQEQT